MNDPNNTNANTTGNTNATGTPADAAVSAGADAAGQSFGHNSSSAAAGPAKESAMRKHGLVSAKLLAIAIGMFGFGYLMVPIYDIICEVTGLNGKTGRVAASEYENVALADPDRMITVEFVGIVNAGGSWEFKPEVSRMQVKPGVTYNTSFFAKNLSSQPVVGQASPSVSPATAAKYFNKTECFCFTRQEFDANSGRDMGIVFVIDPELPANVDLVTLSYTFFRSQPPA